VALVILAAVAVGNRWPLAGNAARAIGRLPRFHKWVSNKRAHITAGGIRYIDKETSSMWAHGDDLSVITENDETGFRVLEYGRNRKVELPDSLKHEIRETRLQRELRRRKIGQHTIEKAVHGRVRMSTYKKIVAAIDEYKREKDKLGEKSECTTQKGNS
jgi:hypothetical protein